jgi:uncharacterized membrane protein
MDKETATISLVLITIIAVFVTIQPLLPSNNEKFSELGILGSNQTIANYPTNIKVGQQFSLFGYIGDHEGAVDYYMLMIKLGNQSTIVTNSTAASGVQLLATYPVILDDNQSTTFPIDMSLNQTGTNLKLIFELWSYNVTTSAFDYDGLWNQLYVNVTS